MISIIASVDWASLLDACVAVGSATMIIAGLVRDDDVAPVPVQERLEWLDRERDWRKGIPVLTDVEEERP